MKKALRAIVFLAALAILTAALVADTLSNYIMKGSKQDSATASKFGVVIRISDESAFDTSYDSPDGQNATVTAMAPTVAPGTSDKGGVLITVSGKPEVQTRLKFDLEIESDVFLRKSKTECYYPLVFTFSKVGDETGDITPVVLKTGTLAEIAKYMKEEFPESDHALNDPKTDIKAVYCLNWSWAYEQDDSTDAYDTTLGDLAAGKQAPAGMVSGDDYSTEIEYTLIVTVMQVKE